MSSSMHLTSASAPPDPRAPTSLNRLHHDCVLDILRFVEAGDAVFRLGATSRAFRSAVMGDDVWEMFCHRDVPPTLLEQHLQFHDGVPEFSRALWLLIPILCSGQAQRATFSCRKTITQQRREATGFWKEYKKHVQNEAAGDCDTAFSQKLQQHWAAPFTPPGFWLAAYNVLLAIVHEPEMVDYLIAAKPNTYFWDDVPHFEKRPFFIHKSCLELEYHQVPGPLPDAAFELASTFLEKFEATSVQHGALGPRSCITAGFTTFGVVIEFFFALAYKLQSTAENVVSTSGIDETSPLARPWVTSELIEYIKWPFGLLLYGVGTPISLFWNSAFNPLPWCWSCITVGWNFITTDNFIANGISRFGSLCYSFLPSATSPEEHREWAAPRVQHYSFTEVGSWYTIAWNTPIDFGYLLRDPYVQTATATLLALHTLRERWGRSSFWVKHSAWYVQLWIVADETLWQLTTWVLLFCMFQQWAKGFRWPLRWLLDRTLPFTAVGVVIALVVTAVNHREVFTKKKMRKYALKRMATWLRFSAYAMAAAAVFQYTPFHEIYFAVSKKVLLLASLGTLSEKLQDAQLNFDYLDDIAVYGLVSGSFWIALLRTFLLTCWIPGQGGHQWIEGNEGPVAQLPSSTLQSLRAAIVTGEGFSFSRVREALQQLRRSEKKKQQKVNSTVRSLIHGQKTGKKQKNAGVLWRLGKLCARPCAHLLSSISRAILPYEHRGFIMGRWLGVFGLTFTIETAINLASVVIYIRTGQFWESIVFRGVVGVAMGLNTLLQSRTI